jgi:hypothetical protein
LTKPSEAEDLKKREKIQNHFCARAQLTLEGEHIKARYSYYFKCPICKTVKVFEFGKNYGMEQWVNRTNGLCPKCHTTVKDWRLCGWESGNDVEFIVDIAYCKKCGLEFTLGKPRRDDKYYNWMKKYIGKCDNCKVEEAPNCWYWYPREKVQFD